MKRKKLLLLLVLVAGVESLQEDYEEEVFLNKCELDTAKIYDSLHVLNPKVESDLEKLKSALTAELTTAKRQMTQERDQVVEKVEGELEKLKSALTAEFATLKKQMTEELNQAVEKLSPCGLFKNKTKGVALKKLSTGTYVYDNTIGGADDTLEWCMARGMRLPRFESLDEMKVVKESAPITGCRWVGAYNDGSDPPDYRWSDGTKVATQFWKSGYPQHNKAGKKTCAFLDANPGTHKLWDYDCGGLCYTLCEVDAQFSHCV